MQNLDEMAEKYIQAVEKQKRVENADFDGKFTRGDMETCCVYGAQEAMVLHEGETGTFGQAIGSLKHGFLVAARAGTARACSSSCVLGTR